MPQPQPGYYGGGGHPAAAAGKINFEEDTFAPKQAHSFFKKYKYINKELDTACRPNNRRMEDTQVISHI